MLASNKARRWAREEYIKRKTKEKKGIRDEELLLQALMTDAGNIDDDNDSYQQKLDEYFSKLSQKNLSIIDELGMIKLNAEIKNLTEEERVILEATKEMGNGSVDSSLP
ncbi:hypothetical protein niasHT_010689 [Heterodera trifolii]|uniref:Uncharacterized protein n=1 Tax=Heterodera trifolii TaxID=157864 RepID=A0ABD2LEK8_9BILA